MNTLPAHTAIYACNPNQVMPRAQTAALFIPSLSPDITKKSSAGSSRLYALYFTNIHTLLSNFAGKIPFFAGKNSFSAGKISFSAGKNSFSAGKNSFSAGKNSFFAGKISFFAGKNSFFAGKNSFSAGKISFSAGKISFSAGKNSFSVGRTAEKNGTEKPILLPSIHFSNNISPFINLKNQ